MITVAVQSKTRIVFPRSNLEMVGSNLTPGMDTVFLLSLLLGLILRPEILQGSRRRKDSFASGLSVIVTWLNATNWNEELT
jgi:hypothetical protein